MRLKTYILYMSSNQEFIHSEKINLIPDNSNATEDENIYSVSDIHGFFGFLLAENAELRKQKELIDEIQSNNLILKDENTNLRNVIVDQAKELKDCKEKLKHAQEYIITIENCKNTGYLKPAFNYVYKIEDYGTNASCEDIETIYDVLLNLVDAKQNAIDYLFPNTSAIVPIYIVLTDSQNVKGTKYQYMGTLQDFCDAWNANVVQRISDEERKQQLFCKFGSLKATLYKAPWKNTSPGSWRRSANEGHRSKKILYRAANIKERLENKLGLSKV